MANTSKRTPQGGNQSNIDELFRMLDQLENRNLGEDIEEAILQYGYGKVNKAVNRYVVSPVL